MSLILHNEYNKIPILDLIIKTINTNDNVPIVNGKQNADHTDLSQLSKTF